MPNTLNQPLIVAECVESEPVHVSVAGGEAVICSFRSPDKDSPNEDAAVIVPLNSKTAILAVADGVGGSRMAHTASAEAVKALSRIYEQAKKGEPHSRAAIVNAIERANESVRDSGNGAATTLAVVEIDDYYVRPIHIGDSAVLVLGQRRRVRMQTVAHSPIGYAIEAGVMDEGEAMHHEDRHLVSNVIGADDMRIEIGHRLRLARRDTVVLVTDGVLDNLHLDELIDFVRVGSLEVAAERVMTAVQQRMIKPEDNAPSKPDDTTMILYRRSQ
ncbi:MAG: protein phosphatase 2C domain-containing protein [Gammaproteobacteria bacterium]|nr:protein phosphatase 2C domain-containing protein [Gammaproteobacteria bacterium]MDH3769182.1 protein phosphatase 2C domain-containing protein [Gammaproteobacteria bacterium]